MVDVAQALGTAPVKEQRRYLRRSVVATQLGVSARTLERWADTGEGPPFVPIGGLCLYPAEQLEAWIAAKTVTATPASRRRAA